jgi:hypothetical protein
MAPSTLTAALVANPAKSRTSPKARAIGHAVGAGTAIVFAGTSSTSD